MWSLLGVQSVQCKTCQNDSCFFFLESVFCGDVFPHLQVQNDITYQQLKMVVKCQFQFAPSSESLMWMMEPKWVQALLSVDQSKDFKSVK